MNDSRYDDSYEDILTNFNGKQNDSISDLLNFNKLRISALTKAAEISPMAKEVTIGPNSPIKNQEIIIEPPPNNVEETNKENLIEDSIREDLRYTLMMKRFDKELQKNSEELFKDLIENMIAKRAEAMSKYWMKQRNDCEKRALEQRRRKLQLLQGLQENDNLAVLEKAKYDEKNSQAISQDAIKNMNRILEEQNKATSQIAAITNSHTKICMCYNELIIMLQTEPLGKSICDKYIRSINTVITNINLIMNACNSGAISDKEVKQSEVLATNIENLRKTILDELNVMKKNELLNKQKELEEAKKKELIEKEEKEKIKLIESQKVSQIAAEKVEQRNRPLFYSSSNYKQFLELKTFLDSYENQYQELLQNINLKKYRFECQKAVNTPVNALSSVSVAHMTDKFDKLSKLLKGEQVQVLDGYFLVTQHPQGLSYCTALLAKKIVRQGELLVSSNSEAAYPIAAVVVGLCSQFPVFGKLLNAYFHKYCPYLVPMFLPQKEGQSDKDFYMSRGYTYNDEGVVEKQDKFLKRMSGIFQLQCAIWIAKTPRSLNTPNPCGLKFGWQWLASFINLRPEPDICATLLHDFLTICGSEFIKHYRKQFIKILKLINSDYLKILNEIDEGGPKTRLEVFLQTVLKTGHIPPPSGVLPPNTW